MKGKWKKPNKHTGSSLRMYIVLTFTIELEKSMPSMLFLEKIKIKRQ